MSLRRSVLVLVAAAGLLASIRSSSFEIGRRPTGALGVGLKIEI